MTSTRTGRLRAAAPGALVLLTMLAVLSLLATLPLSLLSRQLGSGIVAVVIGIPCTAVGVLVARRQPGNPPGWLFLITGGLLLVSNDAGDYAYYVYRLGHQLPFGPAALVIEQLSTAGPILFVVIILLFPDGRLTSRVWRWALRVFGALYVALLAAVAVATGGTLAARPVRVDAAGGLSAIDNPAGWFRAADHSLLLALVALAVAFIARQLLSWRRSSGDRREQLKWLASGAVVSIVSAVAAVPLSTPGTSTALQQLVGDVLWCGLAALPVSMGVAILRYRLYEIDRIISRTLAYAGVTGLLVGVYAALVLAAGAFGFRSQVAVAAATLAAAALFNPLRRRVQHFVDRRFNRARYDADVTVAAFAARLKDAVELDAVRADLTGVVKAALEPAHVSLWTAERP